LGGTLYGEVAQDFFGTSIGINGVGNRIIAGAHQNGVINNNKGYVKIFELQGNSWSQKGNRINGDFDDDEAGKSVSISTNGNRIAFAAPRNDISGSDSGQVKIFEFQNGDWAQLGDDIYGDIAGDLLGDANEPGANAIELNSVGNRIAIGSPGQAQRVRVYSFNGNNWEQLANDIVGPSGIGRFGGAISLNNFGNIVVIGNFSADSSKGQVSTYKLEVNTWIQKGQDITGTNSADFLGYSVGINGSGKRIIVGAPFNDDIGVNQGKVEIFQNDDILSSSETDVAIQFSIFPNPSDGHFALKFAETISNLKVSIADVSGKLIYFRAFSSSELIKINQQLSTGMYFINVKSDITETTVKMIVE
jgi:Secretion system C-terminal sorting domain